MNYLLYLLFCHIIGWFMTGYIVIRLLVKDDIRLLGSGNIGALNSGRIGGRKAFVLTFLGDSFKGGIAVMTAQHLARFCLQHKYDLAVISGTTRQLKLYKQMGFVPFARLVGTEDALYQPMYLTKDTYKASLAGRLQPRPLSFLPGPVPVSEEVTVAFQRKALSHRSSEFKQIMHDVRKRLCKLTNSGPCASSSGERYFS